VSDEACVAFLKWSLPQLGLHWPGYRKVRRLVCKRLNRRLAELSLRDLSEYRDLLLHESGEWARLDAICRIPISRFYRDRGVFDAIGQKILPELAARAAERDDRTVRCWSAGCASGEEPFTLMMLWRYRVAPDWPRACLEVLATDADEVMIARAQAACYVRSSLKDLPQKWLEAAFVRSGDLFYLTSELRRGVEFQLQDIRSAMPDGPFGLILCRNMAFTYFDEQQQRQILDRLKERLHSGGYLVLGMHETLPVGSSGFDRLAPGLPIYRRERPTGGTNT